MLETHDSALIIGDLRLFESPAAHVMDLGAAWKELTGLPFVYAAWLARQGTEESALPPLMQAQNWGTVRLAELSRKWSQPLNLPLDRVEDYFFNVMRYDLDEGKRQALETYRRFCEDYRLIEKAPAHASVL
jgi:chorismate dehydratase